MDELQALKRFSARIGADPTLIQGAGGNTSLKTDAAMWIKASGAWLAHAMTREVMAPVALAPLRAAMEANDPRAEKAQDFVIAALDRSGLRPSIETTVHAAFEQRVVIHVHCVDTIAAAVRRDRDTLERRLAGFDWIHVPYIRPGLPLSREIAARLTPGIDVAVLGNHGLVVAADSVAGAQALLTRVREALAVPPRAPGPTAPDATLARLAAGAPYRAPRHARAHAVACDPVSLAIAAQGALYPDHVIFLGTGCVIAERHQDAKGVLMREQAAGRPVPTSILFPGQGVLMHETASDGAEELARCLADVAARIPAEARLRPLTPDETHALLDWDAEKYRQSLETAPAESGA